MSILNTMKRRLKNGGSGKTQTAKAAQADSLLRLLVAFILIVVLFAALVARFVYLQVFRHDDFSGQASSNRITLIPTPPVRGEIVDVNGVPLAKNYPVFSLEVIPSRIEGKMEDVIEALRKYVDITPTDLKRFHKYRESYRKFENIPLKLRLTDEEAAKLSVHLNEFKGVEVNSRTFREYPYGKLTSHFLGYIGRISDKDQEILEEEGLTALYRGSTHIGKSGLEKFYEPQLHGAPGYQEVEKDAYGNIVRVWGKLCVWAWTSVCNKRRTKYWETDAEQLSPSIRKTVRYWLSFPSLLSIPTSLSTASTAKLGKP